MIDAVQVRERVDEQRRRIAEAGGDGVRLVAVTKTHGVEAIRAAVAAGCTAIGENYVQELVAKVAELDPAERPEIRFIGRLQTNKVRQLLGVVDVIETVDRDSLIAEIARRIPGCRIFVQVNVSGEAQKGGCRPEEVADLVASARAAGLRVEGLMTVGRTGPPDAAAPGFRQLRALADEVGLAECSMGMTADLEVAVAAGSTEVRVGSAIFGERVRRLADPLR